MTRRILVVTTVHHPDDTRIRHKLLPALAAEWDVTYATRTPGPSDRAGVEWVALKGGRLRRGVAAARLLWSRQFELRAIHDPELLIPGLVAALAGRKILFDVHEDVPAQILTKSWLPRPLRRPLAVVASAMLRAAEKTMRITLAEPGYQRLFRRPHPVIPNYPDPAALPEPRPGGGYAVYVGDVTVERGAELMVEAAARAGVPLRVVGRCTPALAATLSARGGDVELVGRLPHPQALEVAAGATVGLSPLADLPNYRHSLPTKVLEYLAVGVPVVASDLPGTAEVIGGLPGVVLVRPGDVAAWTDAIARAHHDTALRAAARRGAEEVRRRFTWSPADVLAAYS